MENNYFRGDKEQPYHLSVGAIVRNEKGEVACHYFKTITHSDVGTITDLYILMRETMEKNESIEECLARGLRKEFGMTATLKGFAESIVCHFSRADEPQTVIEKTTLYFLCDFVALDESQREEGDIEATSEIRWVQPAELIGKMKEQGVRNKREDMDESKVLEGLLSLQ